MAPTPLVAPVELQKSLALCQRDCYRRQIRATVLRCEKAPSKPAKDASQIWVAQLAETVLYAEGGGQPGDSGWLSVLQDGSSSKVQVVDVQTDQDGSVVHHLKEPVPEGAEVTVETDWARRYDHMQQHTCQHLVSAAADMVCGADTSSWELHPRSDSTYALDSVFVDLACTSITPAQIQDIERVCNDAIRQACSVSALVITSRQDPVLQSPIFRGTLPPEDKVKGPLRLIQIEGIDINACGGTHLKSTAEIQGVKIASVDKKAGQVRIGFLAGDRLLSALGRCLLHEAALNKAIGCGPQDHEKIIEKLQGDRRELERSRKGLLEEVAAHLGSELAACATPGGCAHFHRDSGDLAFLSAVAAAALESCSSGLYLLTGGDIASAKKGTAVEGPFLIAGPPDRVKAVGPKVAALLGGRGGGRPGRYQGKATAIEKAAQALTLLKEAALSECQSI